MVDAGKLCAVGQVMIVIDTGGTASPSAAPTPAAQAPVTQAAPASSPLRRRCQRPFKRCQPPKPPVARFLATPATRQLCTGTWASTFARCSAVALVDGSPAMMSVG